MVSSVLKKARAVSFWANRCPPDVPTGCLWLVARGQLVEKNVCRPNVETPAHRVPFLGNPTAYACWKDEALNAVLRSFAEVAHRSTFYIRIHLSFNLVAHLRLNSFIAAHPETSDTGFDFDDEDVDLGSAILDT